MSIEINRGEMAAQQEREKTILEFAQAMFGGELEREQALDGLEQLQEKIDGYNKMFGKGRIDDGSFESTPAGIVDSLGKIICRVDGTKYEISLNKTSEGELIYLTSPSDLRPKPRKVLKNK